MSSSRREFLRRSAGALSAATPLQALLAGTANGAERRTSPGYGPLAPVKDSATGLELLQLPEGFTYTSYGWANDPMDDGRPTPPMHDGMAVVRERNGIATMIRNHEISGSDKSFGGESLTYDAAGKAGCTQLDFDTRKGEFVSTRVAIAGTVRNCAGGPTPWGTWLTCEETVVGPETEKYSSTKYDLDETHGWIFEVHPDGETDPAPLKDMGRFVHEAVAVDPETGIVYETEDRGTSGLYRFLPNEKGKLARGGRLQMLKTARPDMRKGVERGRPYDVEWVDVEDPHLAHAEDARRDELGVYTQGKQAGGTTFARLEGCWYSETDKRIYFTATSGGDASCGQVFAFAPADQTLELVYESPRKSVLDYPDNLTVSPRGGLLVCEDGKAPEHRLHGLTPAGELFDFARNNVVLKKGDRDGVRPGDYRAREWAGVTFTADGRWLFVNVQSPGITFAITGPWENGAL